ncbi:MAG: hypothetical protein ABW003_17735 [Microvirga sp.]|jgi:hypothetical protein
MTAEEIQVLTTARESLAKRRFEVARVIAESTRPSVDTAEELSKILRAIEGLDRALNEAGHPYMSKALVDEAGT